MEEITKNELKGIKDTCRSKSILVSETDNCKDLIASHIHV